MTTLTSPYDARVVGNSFIDIAQKNFEVVSPMKLQKLVYIAHGWYLAFYGKKLVEDPIEAWQYGPVIRSLYFETQKFGSQPVSEYYTILDPDTLVRVIPYVNEMDMGFLRIIWKAYGKYNAHELVNITHKEDTPWSRTYKKNHRNLVIDTEEIREHYMGLMERLDEREAQTA